jgi:transketolase
MRIIKTFENFNQKTDWSQVEFSQFGHFIGGISKELGTNLFKTDAGFFVRGWSESQLEDLIPLEPIADKVTSFGWNVLAVDGHDFQAMETLFSSWTPSAESPTAIIASTQRGKGVPSIANRADRWFCNFTHDEVRDLLQELHGNASAQLQSEPLIVR